MGSESQNKLFEMLKVCFYKRHIKECIKDYRPDWMKSPLTDKNLEIDLWFKSLKLGVEFQGNQHYFKVKGMYNNMEKTTRNDMLKYELFRKHKGKFSDRLSLVLFFPCDLTDNKEKIFSIVDSRIKAQATNKCYLRCKKMIDERKEWYKPRSEYSIMLENELNQQMITAIGKDI